ELTRRHRGLRPPRYPSLWEAVAHSIVFQQISLHAAAAIMQRFVHAFSIPTEDEGVVLLPFPAVEAVADAAITELQRAGLSSNKAVALRQAAIAFSRGEIDEAALRESPSAEAVALLSRLRGIGPWSAAVILLRGLGRLDVFPLNDSGVASSIKLLAGDATVDLDRLLLQLGDRRGMLYFHLLIGRLTHAEGKHG
ncbi:MAG: DNA-3-methyladenine glycosylase 2 family protein, partial [Candidatus Eremiobacteraeota bacterium]|nr:DNA-3-methyladenine glycosylase 2 family protein [Candidatus Eremiobacteraeota bacterium]